MVSYPVLDEGTTKMRDASKITIRDADCEKVAEIGKKNSTLCGVNIKIVTLVFIAISTAVLVYKRLITSSDHEVFLTLRFFGFDTTNQIPQFVAAFIQLVCLLALLISLKDKPAFVIPSIIYHILLTIMQLAAALVHVYFYTTGSSGNNESIMRTFFGSLCDVLPVCEIISNAHIGYAVPSGMLIIGALINILIVIIVSRLFGHLKVITLAKK